MSKIIKLEQPGCRPCQMVSMFLGDQGVEYETIDVTENPDVASHYGVMGVPVTILLDDEDNEVKRSQGFNPSELEEIINLNK
jgi:thioredoxin 1